MVNLFLLKCAKRLKMDSINTIVTAICMWASLACPAQAKDTSHEYLECFKSIQQLHQAHPGASWKRHRTPNGMCYHIGQRNHSGTFVDTSLSPTKDGDNLSTTIEKPKKEVKKKIWGHSVRGNTYYTQTYDWLQDLNSYHNTWRDRGYGWFR
jgi:hypothetical protein